jgi:hypothetical protein
LPYKNSYNFFFLDISDDTYPGINGNDIMSSAWPIYWKDIGMADPDSPDAMNAVTHAQAHCWLVKDNAPYVYLRYFGAPSDGDIPGIEDPAKLLSPDTTLTPSCRSSNCNEKVNADEETSHAEFQKDLKWLVIALGSLALMFFL